MPLSRQTVYLIWMLWLFSLSQSKDKGPKLYRMEKMCGETVIMMHESIYTGDIHFTFQPAMYNMLRDCVIYVEGGFTLGNKINFYFTEFQLMDDCIRNRTRVTVSEIDSASPGYVGYVAGFPASVCGNGSGIVGRAFSTNNLYLAVRFQTSYKYHTSEFSLVFNVFNEAPCITLEHSCDNHRCISKDLTCNDRNPCGDHSDCKNSRLSTGHIAVGIVVGVTVVVLSVICSCLYIVLKDTIKARVERRDDRRREAFHQIAPSRSNRDTSDTRTTRDRSDQENIELRVELAETRTNRRNSPAQSSNLPPSYESLEQIPGSSGAQTIPEIHPAATDAQSSYGHDVNTSSPYNSREHLNADDTRLPRSDGAGNGTEPHYPAQYVAPPPEYMTAVTYSEEYKVTPPSCSDV